MAGSGDSSSDSLPGEVCSTNGEYTRSGGVDAGGITYFMVCKDGHWNAVMEAEASTASLSVPNLTGIGVPVAASDAANKEYVDTVASAGGGSGGTCYYSTGVCAQGFTQMPGSYHSDANAHNVCCSAGFFPADTVPNSYDIADAEIGQNDEYVSAVHQVVGITEAPISVAGDGNPQYQICNDDTCTDIRVCSNNCVNV